VAEGVGVTVALADAVGDGPPGVVWGVPVAGAGVEAGGTGVDDATGRSAGGPVGRGDGVRVGVGVGLGLLRRQACRIMAAPPNAAARKRRRVQRAAGVSCPLFTRRL